MKMLEDLGVWDEFAQIYPTNHYLRGSKTGANVSPMLEKI